MRPHPLPPPPLPLAEALALLDSRVPAPVRERVPLDRAAGAVLAEAAVLDLDMPPFDRAMMDGYAIVAADSPGVVEVVGEIAAGHPIDVRVSRGRGARIMTGAPLPPGADAILQVEKTEAAGAGVRLLEAAKPGQNVAPRGSDSRKGAVVLEAGTRIGPAQLSVLAAAGVADVPVYRRPLVAMMATGDELVPPSATPGPGQIRNSNGYGVPAQVRALGLDCEVLGPVPDRMEDLVPSIRRGLARDVLILSGGVSAGDRDLVVPALEAEGVTQVLHQVRIRPGKPLYVGLKGRTAVFGLPGNPVSSFVTFEILVRPFLGRMMGWAGAALPRARARLAAALKSGGDRTTFRPARRAADGTVAPLAWAGSGDLFALAKADSLIVQPEGAAPAAGEEVEIVVLP